MDGSGNQPALSAEGASEQGAAVPAGGAAQTARSPGHLPQSSPRDADRAAAGARGNIAPVGIDCRGRQETNYHPAARADPEGSPGPRDSRQRTGVGLEEP